MVQSGSEWFRVVQSGSEWHEIHNWYFGSTFKVGAQVGVRSEPNFACPRNMYRMSQEKYQTRKRAFRASVVSLCKSALQSTFQHFLNSSSWPSIQTTKLVVLSLREVYATGLAWCTMPVRIYATVLTAACHSSCLSIEHRTGQPGITQTSRRCQTMQDS